MSRGCGAALARAVGRAFSGFAGSVEVTPIAATDWASVTFNGARHHLRATLAGAGAVGAAADFLARMEDVEFKLRGQIVADLALLAEQRHDGGALAVLDLEALTIEDR